jgi:hypothetical protein
VDRWVTIGRVPHQRHRLRAAETLTADEGFLWPETATAERARERSHNEVVTVFPYRGAVPPDLWRTLAEGAREHIDVLVYSGLFLLDTYPELPSTLAKRAVHEGVQVRLMYGDPSSISVLQRGVEEGIGEDLTARIRLSLNYLQPITEAEGVDIRLHDSVLYSSMYRFDDDLLVNAHVGGSPAAQNPVLHLRRVEEGYMFDHYVRSLDRVWSQARPLEQPAQP